MTVRSRAAWRPTYPMEAKVAIRIQKKSATTSKVMFVLPDEVHPGAVSAVGTFNDWRPGAHKLVKRSNGTRSVSVEVPAGQEICFRYLGDGGVWFDDPDAETVTHEGTLVKV
jgi:hypothetical protein